MKYLSLADLFAARNVAEELKHGHLILLDKEPGNKAAKECADFWTRQYMMYDQEIKDRMQIISRL